MNSKQASAKKASNSATTTTTTLPSIGGGVNEGEVKCSTWRMDVLRAYVQYLPPSALTLMVTSKSVRDETVKRLVVSLKVNHESNNNNNEGDGGEVVDGNALLHYIQAIATQTSANINNTNLSITSQEAKERELLSRVVETDLMLQKAKAIENTKHSGEEAEEGGAKKKERKSHKKSSHSSNKNMEEREEEEKTRMISKVLLRPFSSPQEEGATAATISKTLSKEEDYSSEPSISFDSLSSRSSLPETLLSRFPTNADVLLLRAEEANSSSKKETEKKKKHTTTTTTKKTTTLLHDLFEYGLNELDASMLCRFDIGFTGGPEPNIHNKNLKANDSIVSVVLPIEAWLSSLTKAHYGIESIQRALSKAPSRVCGKQLGRNDMVVRCLECGSDPTCVMCIDCFNASPCRYHEHHFSKSGGGMCDCGDPTAWKKESFCAKHSGTSEDYDPTSTIPIEYSDWLKETVYATVQFLVILSQYLTLPKDLVRLVCAQEMVKAQEAKHNNNNNNDNKEEEEEEEQGYEKGKRMKSFFEALSRLYSPSSSEKEDTDNSSFSSSSSSKIETLANVLFERLVVLANVSECGKRVVVEALLNTFKYPNAAPPLNKTELMEFLELSSSYSSIGRLRPMDILQTLNNSNNNNSNINQRGRFFFHAVDSEEEGNDENVSDGEDAEDEESESESENDEEEDTEEEEVEVELNPRNNNNNNRRSQQQQQQEEQEGEKEEETIIPHTNSTLEFLFSEAAISGLFEIWQMVDRITASSSYRWKETIANNHHSSNSNHHYHHHPEFTCLDALIACELAFCDMNNNSSKRGKNHSFVTNLETLISACQSDPKFKQPLLKALLLFGERRQLPSSNSLGDKVGSAFVQVATVVPVVERLMLPSEWKMQAIHNNKYAISHTTILHRQLSVLLYDVALGSKNLKHVFSLYRLGSIHREDDDDSEKFLHPWNHQHCLQEEEHGNNNSNNNNNNGKNLGSQCACALLTPLSLRIDKSRAFLTSFFWLSYILRTSKHVHGAFLTHRGLIRSFLLILQSEELTWMLAKRNEEQDANDSSSRRRRFGLARQRGENNLNTVNSALLLEHNMKRLTSAMTKQVTRLTKKLLKRSRRRNSNTHNTQSIESQDMLEGKQLSAKSSSMKLYPIAWQRALEDARSFDPLPDRTGLVFSTTIKETETNSNNNNNNEAEAEAIEIAMSKNLEDSSSSASLFQVEKNELDLQTHTHLLNRCASIPKETPMLLIPTTKDMERALLAIRVLSTTINSNPSERVTIQIDNTLGAYYLMHLLSEIAMHVHQVMDVQKHVLARSRHIMMHANINTNFKNSSLSLEENSLETKKMNLFLHLYDYDMLRTRHRMKVVEKDSDYDLSAPDSLHAMTFWRPLMRFFSSMANILMVQVCKSSSSSSSSDDNYEYSRLPESYKNSSNSNSSSSSLLLNRCLTTAIEMGLGLKSFASTTLESKESTEESEKNEKLSAMRFVRMDPLIPSPTGVLGGGEEGESNAFSASSTTAAIAALCALTKDSLSLPNNNNNNNNNNSLVQSVLHNWLDAIIMPLVIVSQVEEGLWRRNTMSIADHAIMYASSPNELELDTYLLQVLTVLLPPQDFAGHVLQRFSYLSPKEKEKEKDSDEDDEDESETDLDNSDSSDDDSGEDETLETLPQLQTAHKKLMKLLKDQTKKDVAAASSSSSQNNTTNNNNNNNEPKSLKGQLKAIHQMVNKLLPSGRRRLNDAIDNENESESENEEENYERALHVGDFDTYSSNNKSSKKQKGVLSSTLGSGYTRFLRSILTIVLDTSCATEYEENSKERMAYRAAQFLFNRPLLFSEIRHRVLSQSIVYETAESDDDDEGSEDSENESESDESEEETDSSSDSEATEEEGRGVEKTLNKSKKKTTLSSPKRPREEDLEEVEEVNEKKANKNKKKAQKEEKKNSSASAKPRVSTQQILTEALQLISSANKNNRRGTTFALKNTSAWLQYVNCYHPIHSESSWTEMVELYQMLARRTRQQLKEQKEQQEKEKDSTHGNLDPFEYKHENEGISSNNNNTNTTNNSMDILEDVYLAKRDSIPAPVFFKQHHAIKRYTRSLLHTESSLSIAMHSVHQFVAQLAKANEKQERKNKKEEKKAQEEKQQQQQQKEQSKKSKLSSLASLSCTKQRKDDSVSSPSPSSSGGKKENNYCCVEKLMRAFKHLEAANNNNNNSNHRVFSALRDDLRYCSTNWSAVSLHVLNNAINLLYLCAKDCEEINQQLFNYRRNKNNSNPTVKKSSSSVKVPRKMNWIGIKHVLKESKLTSHVYTRESRRKYLPINLTENFNTNNSNVLTIRDALKVAAPHLIQPPGFERWNEEVMEPASRVSDSLGAESLEEGREENNNNNAKRKNQKKLETGLPRVSTVEILKYLYKHFSGGINAEEAATILEAKRRTNNNNNNVTESSNSNSTSTSSDPFRLADKILHILMVAGFVGRQREFDSEEEEDGGNLDDENENDDEKDSAHASESQERALKEAERLKLEKEEKMNRMKAKQAMLLNKMKMRAKQSATQLGIGEEQNTTNNTNANNNNNNSNTSTLETAAESKPKITEATTSEKTDNNNNNNNNTSSSQQQQQQQLLSIQEKIVMQVSELECCICHMGSESAEDRKRIQSLPPEEQLDYNLYVFLNLSTSGTLHALNAHGERECNAHLYTCGHGAHKKCVKRYYARLSQMWRNRDPFFRFNGSTYLGALEFPCPLCAMAVSTLIPVPSLNTDMSAKAMEGAVLSFSAESILLQQQKHREASEEIEEEEEEEEKLKQLFQLNLYSDDHQRNDNSNNNNNEEEESAEERMKGTFFEEVRASSNMPFVQYRKQLDVKRALESCMIPESSNNNSNSNNRWRWTLPGLRNHFRNRRAGENNNTNTNSSNESEKGTTQQEQQQQQHAFSDLHAALACASFGIARTVKLQSPLVALTVAMKNSITMNANPLTNTPSSNSYHSSSSQWEVKMDQSGALVLESKTATSLTSTQQEEIMKIQPVPQAIITLELLRVAQDHLQSLIETIKCGVCLSAKPLIAILSMLTTLDPKDVAEAMLLLEDKKSKGENESKNQNQNTLRILSTKMRYNSINNNNNNNNNSNNAAFQEAHELFIKMRLRLLAQILMTPRNAISLLALFVTGIVFPMIMSLKKKPDHENQNQNDAPTSVSSSSSSLAIQSSVRMIKKMLLQNNSNNNSEESDDESIMILLWEQLSWLALLKALTCDSPLPSSSSFNSSLKNSSSSCGVDYETEIIRDLQPLQPSSLETRESRSEASRLLLRFLLLSSKEEEEESIREEGEGKAGIKNSLAPLRPLKTIPRSHTNINNNNEESETQNKNECEYVYPKSAAALLFLLHGFHNTNNNNNNPNASSETFWVEWMIQHVQLVSSSYVLWIQREHLKKIHSTNSTTPSNTTPQVFWPFANSNNNNNSESLLAKISKFPIFLDCSSWVIQYLAPCALQLPKEYVDLVAKLSSVTSPSNVNNNNNSSYLSSLLRPLDLFLHQNKADHINVSSRGVCSICGDNSKELVQCCSCGQLFCYGNKTNPELLLHARQCGQGHGLFIHIRSTVLVLIDGVNSRALRPGAPYVDRYGETDLQLRRGARLSRGDQNTKEIVEMWIQSGWWTKSALLTNAWRQNVELL